MNIISKEQERVLVEAIMNGLQFATTVVDVVEIIERDLANLVDAACCTVFFVDVEQGHVWCPPGQPEKRPNGIKVDLGEGLVGNLAKKALDGDQSGVVITNDPQNCPLWAGDQPNSSFRTRNIMTVPVWSPGSHTLLGIVQVINKTEKMRRRGSMMEQVQQSIQQAGGGFTPTDARLIEAIAGAIGHHLQRMLVDLIWTKTRLDHGMQEAAPSMLSEYYDEKVGPKDDGKVFRQESVAFDTTSPRMSSRNSRIDHLQSTLSMDVLLNIRGFAALGFESLQPSEHVDVRRWRVDYFELSEKDEFFMFTQALQEYGLMKDFSLDANVLYNFFVQVKDGYLDVPYHNFRHAMSTVHYTYKLLEASGVAEYLFKTDKFAIIVAALCHDIGHRGRNTAFEVMTHSDLALRYNDSSPLENHHCARTFEIARGDYGDAFSCNIFQSMNAETFCSVRKQMIAGILGTDMRFHGDHVKVAQEFEPGAQLSQRQTIVEIFLHSADISNVCMPADIAKRWNAVIVQEFYEQAKEEQACGIPLTPFMQGMDDPLVAAKSSIGFMDFVVHPLIMPLVRTFPDLAPVKDNLEHNREEALALIAELSEKHHVSA